MQIYIMIGWDNGGMAVVVMFLNKRLHNDHTVKFECSKIQSTLQWYKHLKFYLFIKPSRTSFIINEKVLLPLSFSE